MTSRVAMELPTYDDIALRIHSINLEQVLDQIQVNGRYLYGERSFVVDITTPPLWHKRLPPERGVVHHITTNVTTANRTKVAKQNVRVFKDPKTSIEPSVLVSGKVGVDVD